MKFIIREEKKEKLSGFCKNILYYGRKMMHCLESLSEDDMGEHYEDDDEEDSDPIMGQRSGRSGYRGSMGRGMGRRMRPDDYDEPERQRIYY